MTASAITTHSESLVAALRASTRDVHERLDRRLGLATGSFDRARYGAFLRGSAAAVVPIEESLTRMAIVTDDGLRRTTAVAADLKALGLTMPSPTASPFAIGSRADAIGAAYVVEGSALGGAVLARRVAESLGEGAPRAYLTLRGERTGARWKRVVEAIDAWGRSASNEERARAVAAARETFHAYERAFVACGVLA